MVAAGTVLTGCSTPDEVTPAAAAPTAAPVAAQPATPHPDAVEKARAAARQLAGVLMERLGEELDAGSPKDALTVCADEAQVLTTAQEGEGIHIRRVSLRTRNPNNAPDPWEMAQLEKLQALHDRGELPAEVAVVEASADGDELRYLKPITVLDPCLLCHGGEQDLDPAVVEELARRYPEDRATGYAAGDFRGAVSVRVTLDPQK
jgi:hypothetical protein